MTKRKQAGSKVKLTLFQSAVKPNQVLKSVKFPGNAVDLKPKWSRTLPSLIYFEWDINRDPPP